MKVYVVINQIQTNKPKIEGVYFMEQSAKDKLHNLAVDNLWNLEVDDYLRIEEHELQDTGPERYSEHLAEERYYSELDEGEAEKAMEALYENT